MDFITDLMRQISVIAVLAAFLELLLPNGEMQKFIRFFMGLLILVVFLNPLIKGQLFDVEIASAEMADVMDAPGAQLSTEEILKAGEEMDTNLLGKAKAELEEDISLQILALVRLAPGVERAAVKLLFAEDGSGNIAEVRLTLMVAPGTDTIRVEEEINDLLEAFYHIPQEKITYVMKEAVANDGNEL